MDQRRSFRLDITGSNIKFSAMVREIDPTGVAGTSANGQWRTHGNSGGPAASPCIPGTDRVTKANRWRHATFPMWKSHNTRCRRAKETKQRETNRRKSECLDSTVEVGELPPGGVDGGKRGIGISNRYWETCQMPGNLKSVLTVQQRIAELAQRPPAMPPQAKPGAFFSLAHHIDLYWLEATYHRTRKDGTAGIDDVSGKQYAEKLHDNLQNLLDRLKSGTYKTPPVKRKHIPKGTSGETRPIGIPTFEDKIVQRAVVMLLEPIHEHDFYDSSFGFRPRRSAHQALQAVWDATMEVYGGRVLEVDICKFFDTIDHRHLQEFVSRRVRDGVLRRLIGKWRNAGVMEEEELSFPESDLRNTA